MNVYLINRADRPQRLLHALGQLRAVRLADCVTRIEACTPEHARQERFARFDKRAVENIERGGDRTDLVPTWGAAACALSHHRCWERIAAAGAKGPALIVEDDIEMTSAPHFMFCLQKARCALKLRADATVSCCPPHVWLFGSNNRGAGHPPDRQLEQSTYAIDGIFTGLHCYLINCAAAKLLMRYCSLFTYQVDVQIGQLVKDLQHEQYERERLCVLNSIHSGVTQSAQFDTDVQPMNPTLRCFARMFRAKCPESISRHIVSYLPESCDPVPESLWFVHYRNGYSCCCC